MKRSNISFCREVFHFLRLSSLIVSEFNLERLIAMILRELHVRSWYQKYLEGDLHSQLVELNSLKINEPIAALGG